MIDKFDEQLHLAAKAIGSKLYSVPNKQGAGKFYFRRDGGQQKPWNPLAHKGDALELASALNMVIDFRSRLIGYEVDGEYHDMICRLEGDEAMMECLVAAAAEIGELM